MLETFIELAASLLELTTRLKLPFWGLMVITVFVFVLFQALFVLSSIYLFMQGIIGGIIFAILSIIWLFFCIFTLHKLLKNKQNRK